MAEQVDEIVNSEFQDAASEGGIEDRGAASPFEVLRRRLIDAERDFEESHAMLSVVLGRLSDLLARVGL